MDSTAEKIINQTLTVEGGYVSSSKSPDGYETYRGITRKYYPDWSGWDYIDQQTSIKYNEIFTELEDDVIDFYYDNFYTKYKCDEIDCMMIAGHLFDQCVNGGGVIVLQRTINAAISGANISVDGNMGSQTLAYATNEEYAPLIAAEIANQRLYYYENDCSSLWNTCKETWTQRVEAMTELCS